jgi:hypothetical protein
MKIRWGLWAAVFLMLTAGLGAATDYAPQLPTPGVIDQVTHDHGNIQTTVQNYGYVGGYSWAGYPSGRWPANTQHDYLAEMRFWIGGVNSTGDTLLSNTVDDFNPIPSYIAGNLSHDIRLSTDETRYDYDATDTIGAGIGKPAYGWRVWDVNTREWVYNQVYNPLDSTFYDGGPMGVQESICRYADDVQGSPVMGLEITQTIRQWNYEYNKDIIFFTLEITNASVEDYTSVAIGLYCDFDVGGVDPATGENGRLGDLVAYDTDLDLAWTYDEDGYDPGWGPTVVTGYMGTVVLSTPGDVGMTSFNTDQWEYLPQTDIGRFELIDNTEFDESLPPTDQYYVQAVRGLDLPAGTTVKFDFALVAASNPERLVAVAQRAKALFSSYYNGPSPPDAPIANVSAGDGAILVSWDNTAEESVEWTSGQKDFVGYKIYRSTDRGVTWGTLEVDVDDGSLGPDYYPLATYRIDELGRINRTFEDKNLTNGMEYWYSVVAFDSGTAVYDPLQNDRGNPDTYTNTVSVVPRDDPLGYHSPQETIEHVYSGDWKSSEGTVNIYVVDELNITGDEYQVTFSEECYLHYWNLINTTSGDTVLADQTQMAGFSNGPVADGFQVVVDHPANRFPDTVFQSEYAVPGESTAFWYIEPFGTDVGCSEHYRNDVEIRFTATGSIAYEWWTEAPMSVPFEAWNISTGTQVAVWVADWVGDGEWTITDFDIIIFTNYDYNAGAPHPESYPDYLTWFTYFLDPSDPNYPPLAPPPEGDVFTVWGPRIFSPDDQFQFSSRKIVASEVTENLSKIKVVPNPYLGYAKWDGGAGDRKLQFTNLPQDCTIRIYTLAGELIRTLLNDADGALDWDMLSEAGRGIASGVYLYNVESGYGNYTGKFAVIK